MFLKSWDDDLRVGCVTDMQQRFVDSGFSLFSVGPRENKVQCRESGCRSLIPDVVRECGGSK
jgi:hypothetical protein